MINFSVKIRKCPSPRKSVPAYLMTKHNIFHKKSLK